MSLNIRVQYVIALLIVVATVGILVATFPSPREPRDNGRHSPHSAVRSNLARPAKRLIAGAVTSAAKTLTGSIYQICNGLDYRWPVSNHRTFSDHRTGLLILCLKTTLLPRC